MIIYVCVCVCARACVFISDFKKSYRLLGVRSSADVFQAHQLITGAMKVCSGENKHRDAEVRETTHLSPTQPALAGVVQGAGLGRAPRCEALPWPRSHRPQPRPRLPSRIPDPVSPSRYPRPGIPAPHPHPTSPHGSGMAPKCCHHVGEGAHSEGRRGPPPAFLGACRVTGSAASRWLRPTATSARPSVPPPFH